MTLSRALTVTVSVFAASTMLLGASSAAQPDVSAARTWAAPALTTVKPVGKVLPGNRTWDGVKPLNRTWD